MLQGKIRHAHPPRQRQVKIFAGTATRRLAEDIARHYGSQLGKLTLQRFSDGEMQPVIEESVRGAFVFFIQSTFAPSDNLMELLLMIDAAKRASAGYITAVIPYYGYARQDRKDKPRVPISAKLVADLLMAAGADRIMTMDLHAAQIQGFFDFPVDHLTSEAVFMPWLKKQDLSNVVFSSPDVGGVKRARAYAKHFGCDLVICDKHRVRANEVASITVIGNVEGKEVILIDDLVDTAGTLCTAADELVRRGAKSVRALCTHPVLSGSAYERIDSSALQSLVVTDTIPLKQDRPRDKIQVLSIAPLFAEAIHVTHTFESISDLFQRHKM